MRVVLTGGGTGGHLTPLLAVATALRRLAAQGVLPPSDQGEPPLEILYVGVVTGRASEALRQAGIVTRHVPSGKIRRYASGLPLTLFDILFRLPLGILRGLFAMFVLMPDVVFSKGGYGSIPVVLASALYRIPVLLHETDVVPGLANRRLARLASAVAVSFPAAGDYFPPAKTFVAGTPLREEFLAPPDPAEAKETFGLHDQKPVIFVTGGSLGAQRLNVSTLAVLPALLSEAQVLHQVGEHNLAAVRTFAERDLRHLPDRNDYHPVGFLTARDMACAYAAADLIVSRAGGTTLAEIAAMGKPSLLVPLRESAQQHQWENAYFFREKGAAVVLDESNLGASIFLSALRRTLQNPQDLSLMTERVRQLHAPGSATELARLLVGMAAGRIPRGLPAPAERRPLAEPTSEA